VWDTGLGDELVLAELCRGCANGAAGLLNLYGGHGRETIRLTQAAPVATTDSGPVRSVGGMLARGLVYLLIAVAGFLLVTLVTSQS
jgi:hypothetical protein